MSHCHQLILRCCMLTKTIIRASVLLPFLSSRTQAAQFLEHFSPPRLGGGNILIRKNVLIFQTCHVLQGERALLRDRGKFPLHLPASLEPLLLGWRQPGTRHLDDGDDHSWWWCWCFWSMSTIETMPASKWNLCYSTPWQPGVSMMLFGKHTLHCHFEDHILICTCNQSVTRGFLLKILKYSSLPKPDVRTKHLLWADCRSWRWSLWHLAWQQSQPGTKRKTWRQKQTKNLCWTVILTMCSKVCPIKALIFRAWNRIPFLLL